MEWCHDRSSYVAPHCDRFWIRTDRGVGWPLRYGLFKVVEFEVQKSSQEIKPRLQMLARRAEPPQALTATLP